MTDGAHKTTLAPDALTLTAKQVRAIYDAGRKRGNDEAVSYEWGTRPQGDRYDDLRDELVWRDDLKSDEARDAWWKAFMEASDAR